MSDTGSLEFCKELYELSGWDGTYHVHYYKEDLTAFDASGWHVNSRMKVHQDYIPAYDAGYLLRKLPPLVGREDDFSLVQHKWSESTYHAGYYAFDDMTTLSHLFFEEATTPEDALAKLAIELFKAGILPISGRDL